MLPPDQFATDATDDEVAAGFSVRTDQEPDGRTSGGPATGISVMHSWGDPCHRLVKMHGRDGRTIFQLQAFGRPRSGVGPLRWFAERYWPAIYGPAWVIDRLREHVGRPGYEALIELHEPASDEIWPAPAGSGTDGAHSGGDTPLNRNGTDTLDLSPALQRASEPPACGTTDG